MEDHHMSQACNGLAAKAPALRERSSAGTSFPKVASGSWAVAALRFHLSCADNGATLFAGEVFNQNGLSLKLLFVESGLLVIRETDERNGLAIEFAREGDCIVLGDEAKQRVSQNYSIEALEDTKLTCVPHKRIARSLLCNGELLPLLERLSGELLNRRILQPT
jgi:hypothetical protein